MIDLSALAPEGLSAFGFVGLTVASFFASLLTAAFGIGGGVLMLALMAGLLPPTALIPVHAAVQLASNAGRAALMAPMAEWRLMAAFAAGSVLGVALGGVVAVDLPSWAVQCLVGLFVIWSVTARPPSWLFRDPVLAGGVSSFLTMFFGATGPFVAAHLKAQGLSRHGHVATQGAMMTLQHGLKVVAFALLGFAFAPWALVIAALSLSGLVGTAVGKMVLGRMSEGGFRRILDAALVLIALRLLWSGASDALAAGIF